MTEQKIDNNQKRLGGSSGPKSFPAATATAEWVITVGRVFPSLFGNDHHNRSQDKVCAFRCL
ncbi:MAG: hypothetical protein LJE89_01015, partial [Deltaproteobacteria bacterium]|nr:hypothetical protein [Deltaproteobacteria bacterium]